MHLGTEGVDTIALHPPQWVATLQIGAMVIAAEDRIEVALGHHPGGAKEAPLEADLGIAPPPRKS